MGETSEARDELDRLGRSLRNQLVALITDLTPGADLGLLFLDEPSVADRHEPLRHHYAALFRGERPADLTAAETASRAAVLLDAAGWDVTTSEEYEDGRRCSAVVARRDGIRIRVRTGDHTSAVMFGGRTPALAFAPAEPFRRPEPVRTPDTLTPGYVLCYECGGLGRCPGCGGRGWVPSEPHGRSRCRECRTERVCPICRGGGELAASQLSDYQRGYYPEPD
ncbi:hypothetical protein [Streptomyces sp. NRRL B-24484]|uniref:hypothetical protein n=1 Tax=Streptomyces sp. NRRL B-24484 TaxID=1463833 RepID=UPI0006944BD6|nr:hypothetical protein [Streptomyces sp. NRRL B-24484]